MVTVTLPRLLAERAGLAQIEVDAATVRGVLSTLERDHGLAGWMLDEQGGLRPHVGVFVNAEQASCDEPVGPGDELRILPAISGGAR